MTEQIFSGPCVVCGRQNYALSMGGPSICPACDCGRADPLIQAKTIANLRAQLAAETARANEAERRSHELQLEHNGLRASERGWRTKLVAETARADAAEAKLDRAMTVAATAHREIFDEAIDWRTQLEAATTRLHAISEAAAMALAALGRFSEAALNRKDGGWETYAEGYAAGLLECSKIARSAHQALSEALSIQSKEERT